MKKALFIVLAFVCLSCLSSCSKDDQVFGTVVFTPSSASLKVGMSMDVSFFISATGLEDGKSYQTTLSDLSGGTLARIVTISSGNTEGVITLTGKAEGYADLQVHVTDYPDIKGTLSVTVLE